ncbi:MAG: O-methyltransferase [Solirubrobacterales bacterium]
MGEKFTPMSAELQGYAVEHSRQDEVLRSLDEETAALGDVAVMQMAPEQGALTTLLVRAIGAQRALEVGTFTGYGSISIARGLAGGGRLLTCDVSEEWAEIAGRHFERAGLAERIDLRIGPALETLSDLDPSEPFDFAFIDADKVSYPDYYEEALRLLRPGGMVMVDNVFRGGEVIDPDADDEGVRGIRELNDRMATDPRVEPVAMVGIADGITLALKA